MKANHIFYLTFNLVVFVFALIDSYSPMTSLASVLQRHKVNLILGSGSRTRRQILTDLGVNFNIIKFEIDEKSVGDRTTEDPRSLVLKIAQAKADAIFKAKITPSSSNHLLLTADQVVVFESTILEKPSSLLEARSNIERFRNNKCTTVGSIILTNCETGKQTIGVDSSEIHFGDIPIKIIDKLIEEGEVLHCAGGLMVEHPLLQPYISKIIGTRDSVMGLSSALLEKLVIEAFE